jgi:TldD protein
VSARDGDIDDVSQTEDVGVGVRALVGSGWGFHAVADLSSAAAARAGATAAATAAASARVAGPAARLLPGAPTTATWASPCEVDHFSVPL